MAKCSYSKKIGGGVYNNSTHYVKAHKAHF